MKKQKKSKTGSKKPEKRTTSKRITDKILEEHIEKLVTKLLKKKPEEEKTVEGKVKKTKKEEAKTKKKKKQEVKIKDIYGKKGISGGEYTGLGGAGVYDQIQISSWKGFFYKNNIKTNDEFYKHLEDNKQEVVHGEKDIAGYKMMEEVGWKFMINMVIGTDMNTISVEEKDRVKAELYDVTSKLMYFVNIQTMGFGWQDTTLGGYVTTLKTMSGLGDVISTNTE